MFCFVCLRLALTTFKISCTVGFDFFCNTGLGKTSFFFDALLVLGTTPLGPAPASEPISMAVSGVNLVGSVASTDFSKTVTYTSVTVPWETSGFCLTVSVVISIVAGCWSWVTVVGSVASTDFSKTVTYTSVTVPWETSGFCLTVSVVISIVAGSWSWVTEVGSVASTDLSTTMTSMSVTVPWETSGFC